MKHLIAVATLACMTMLAQTSNWELRLDQSRDLRRQGRYIEAHRLLSELVASAKGIGVASEALALALNDLGGVCVALRRYHEARWAYEESLILLQSQPGETNGPGVNEAKVSSALGVVHGRLGQYKEAARLLENAVLIFERTVGSGDFDFAIALNNLAYIRRMEGRLPEAERLLRRALPILEETLGPNDRRVIIAEANLGLVCAKLGLAAEAESLSSRAVAAMEMQVGSNHPLLTEVLYSRADVLKLAKRKEEAKRTHDRADQLRRIHRRESGIDFTTDVRELRHRKK